MNNFIIGDVVKTVDGPDMTVSGFNDDGTIFCQWFVGNTLYKNNFKNSDLELVRR